MAIAIVGMACRYPDADSPTELWRNVLCQRRAFRRIPPQRLRAEDYLASDPQVPDRTYSDQAAVLEGWEFDRLRFRVAGSTFRSTDLTHWLALEVAAAALADACWEDGEGLPAERTGVLLGNTLTGEFSRARLLRLRWPYVRRVFAAALSAEGRPEEDISSFLQKAEKSFKAPFAPIDDDALAGGLSNTIAGRICNHFDLRGGGYTVDGACAASLLAVTTACNALCAGDVDVALAGGVDLSLDPFELVGFAKVGALAQRSMRVYDTQSDGFWPGEGCGFVVLERLEDALARGATVYATIRGWGVSSDGTGGITRPEAGGQLLALQRAYARAGVGIGTVDLFEGHGTGTGVGDRAELTALTQARHEDGADTPAAIGSVKANIGHTKAAAGVAGLIKAAISVHERIIPPTTACEEPHQLLRQPGAALRVVSTGEPWPHSRRGRASVSAMGFGGINTHVVLEGTASGRRRLSRERRVLIRSGQDAELFTFAAAEPGALRERIDRVRAVADGMSLSDLGDAAATLHRELPLGLRTRAAVVASTPVELSERLDELVAWLADDAQRLDINRRVFLGFGTKRARVGLLFPGQGSPSYLDSGALGRRFPSLQRPGGTLAVRPGVDRTDTAVAQPAIVASSLVGLFLLRRLGLHAAVALGHSLGELTALHWAGALDSTALQALAYERGRAMAELADADGAMASIAASPDVVEPLLVDLDVVIAGYNGPRQTVIAGTAAAVVAVVANAKEAGTAAVRLPVSHAFHSPSVAAAADRLAVALDGVDLCPLQRPAASSVTGEMLAPDADLRELLVDQLTRPVRFEQALSCVAARVDALLEVGPGAVLQGLARQATTLPVVALDAGGRSLRSPLAAAGALFALGAQLRLGPLFAGRFTRPYSFERRQSFLANPCELAPPDDGTPAHETAAVPGGESDSPGSPSAVSDALDVVRTLVAKRAELPDHAVADDSRLLADLHLTSIAVSELAVQAARELGIAAPAAPTELANATVAELAATLEAARSAGSSEPEPTAPDGIAAWVRPFAVRLVERERPSSQTSRSRWSVLASDEYPFREGVEAAFAGDDGEPAVLVCVPPSPSVGESALLLRAAAEIHARGARRCAFVQHEGGAAGFAKTLHLERPEIHTCVIDLPTDGTLLSEARREAEGTHGFREVHYDGYRVRRVPLLSPIEPAPGEPPLAADDVLLVSGGGKGIAAECALALGRSTGASVALIGRSLPGRDPELRENLARFEDAGVRHRYLRVDVTDAAALKAVIADVRAQLGEVTAVLHGAGVNVPSRLEYLDEQAVARTVAPKLSGARNLLAALDGDALRLFVTFGSIIGRIGMRGEAHYALANDWLAKFMESVSQSLPHCRCLNLEWSVWTGAGMGERLGTVAALSQQGVTPIPIDEGVRLLEMLVRCRGLPSSVVVAGRFGSPRTVALDGQHLPLLRFLERPRVHYPGIELVVDAELSRGTDPYLDDHQLDGAALFPAVFGLEAMASVAQALTGRADIPAFTDVEFARSVSVPESSARSIRVVGLARPTGGVDLAVRSEETGFQVDHFRATCQFDYDPIAERRTAPETATAKLSLDTERQLYGGILFQGPRFQRLSGYRELHARACVAEVKVKEDMWFASFLPQALVLSDPGARDAIIHAIQACIPHERLIPIAVERLVTRELSSGPLTVRAHERSSDGETFIYDVVVVDPAGQVCECWRGLSLRRVGPAPRRTAWPATLLAPYLERRVSDLMGDTELTVVIANGEPNGRAASDAAITRLLGPTEHVRRRPDGRPLASGRQCISTAHIDGYTLAVAGSSTLACDFEVTAGRSERVWADLLGDERLRLARLLAAETGERLDTAATRVWAAAECIKKAGLPVSEPLTLSREAGDGWLILQAGHAPVATYVTGVDRVEQPVVLALLVGSDAR